MYAEPLHSLRPSSNISNQLGLGKPAPVLSLDTQFKGTLPLVWADNTTKVGNPTPQAVTDHISANFNTKQRAAVRKLSSVEGFINECPSNFNGFSPCFLGIVFESIPELGGSVITLFWSTMG